MARERPSGVRRAELAEQAGRSHAPAVSEREPGIAAPDDPEQAICLFLKLTERGRDLRPREAVSRSTRYVESAHRTRT